MSARQEVSVAQGIYWMLLHTKVSIKKVSNGVV